MMDEQLKSNLTSSKHWIRLFFMILFALALQIASVVMTALVVVQFFFALITGSDNSQLRKFGDSLSIFIFNTLQFLIYNSEEKPFPFADWPESKIVDGVVQGASDDVTANTVKKTVTKRKPAAKKKPAADEDESAIPDSDSTDGADPDTTTKD